MPGADMKNTGGLALACVTTESEWMQHVIETRHARLVPGIHVFSIMSAGKAWMAGQARP